MGYTLGARAVIFQYVTWPDAFALQEPNHRSAHSDRLPDNQERFRQDTETLALRREALKCLSPGGEKMSRHSVTRGDIAGLFSFFAALRQKATRRKNMLYPLVVIQEAGPDGFGLGRVLSKEAWIESTL